MTSQAKMLAAGTAGAAAGGVLAGTLTTAACFSSGATGTGGLGEAAGFLFLIASSVVWVGFSIFMFKTSATPRIWIVSLGATVGFVLGLFAGF